MNSIHRVFLHTGSNIGDRLRNLEQALENIETRIGAVTMASRVFETKAWGITDQPDFLNQAVEVLTPMDPYQLLEAILEIEKTMGRKREIKWGKRLIDIDILFYEDLVIASENLTIPHPFLHERKFVLEPLMDIAPDFVHPVLKKTIRRLWEELGG
jgi:2-amino-4-hydroxy-6-hydroxymethyldihydropteridine diphosphokinase